jgi:hypothetical protein
MGRTENIRDVTIALTSTGALLLTILAVGHVPALRGWGTLAAVLALWGLYLNIALGGVVMWGVVWDPRDPFMWWPVKAAFYLQFFSFAAGLGGIVVVILFQMAAG